MVHLALSALPLCSFSLIWVPMWLYAPDKTVTIRKAQNDVKMVMKGMSGHGLDIFKGGLHTFHVNVVSQHNAGGRSQCDEVAVNSQVGRHRLTTAQLFVDNTQVPLGNGSVVN